MTLSSDKLISAIRPYLRRQKQKLKYRIQSPVRYSMDISRARMFPSPSIGRGLIRIALVSDLDAPSSEQQFHPFSKYRHTLREALGVVSMQLMLKDVVRFPRLLSQFDLVILKMTYRTDPDVALRVAQSIRQAVSSKPVIYFDGDDDICVQWPEIMPYVDLYVKKHAFRDRSQYSYKFIGKSNLHDYVCRTHNYVLTTRDYGNPWEKQLMIGSTGPVPKKELDKIVVGTDLVTDAVIADYYDRMKDEKAKVDKEFDIIFRGSVTPGTITYHLRCSIEPILRKMEKEYRVIIPNRRVARDDYYREMRKSRICVSPFGYGEICWRDYEAVLCRSLLAKPNMSHIETYPNIFRAHETYIPIEWDFSDLQEKCTYYLSHEVERERIIANAYRVMDEFYKDHGFIKSTRSILARVGFAVEERVS